MRVCYLCKNKRIPNSSPFVPVRGGRIKAQVCNECYKHLLSKIERNNSSLPLALRKYYIERNCLNCNEKFRTTIRSGFIYCKKCSKMVKNKRSVKK